MCLTISEWNESGHFTVSGDYPEENHQVRVGSPKDMLCSFCLLSFPFVHLYIYAYDVLDQVGSCGRSPSPHEPVCVS